MRYFKVKILDSVTTMTKLGFPYSARNALFVTSRFAKKTTKEGASGKTKTIRLFIMHSKNLRNPTL
jgi:hypothetical protein